MSDPLAHLHAAMREIDRHRVTLIVSPIDAARVEEFLARLAPECAPGLIGIEVSLCVPAGTLWSLRPGGCGL